MLALFRTLRRARQEKLFWRGYSFAATSLMQDPCDANIGTLLGYVDYSRQFNAYDEFDHGIESAVQSFEGFRKNLKRKAYESGMHAGMKKVATP